MSNPRRRPKPSEDALAAIAGQSLAEADQAETPAGSAAAPDPTPHTRRRRSAAETLVDQARQNRGGRPPKGERQVAMKVYTAESQAGRYKAAWQALPYSVRPASYSDFVDAAILDRVEAIEAEYNDGKQFEPIEKLPPGRKAKS